jgi:hypothetical protein
MERLPSFGRVCLQQWVSSIFKDESMSPFESLYGRKCNTLVSWDNPADRAVVGPYILREMEEKMVKIMKNLKVSQDRQ